MRLTTFRNILKSQLWAREKEKECEKERKREIWLHVAGLNVPRGHGRHFILNLQLTFACQMLTNVDHRFTLSPFGPYPWLLFNR